MIALVWRVTAAEYAEGYAQRSDCTTPDSEATLPRRRNHPIPRPIERSSRLVPHQRVNC